MWTVSAIKESQDHLSPPVFPSLRQVSGEAAFRWRHSSATATLKRVHPCLWYVHVVNPVEGDREGSTTLPTW